MEIDPFVRLRNILEEPEGLQAKVIVKQLIDEKRVRFSDVRKWILRWDHKRLFGKGLLSRIFDALLDIADRLPERMARDVLIEFGFKPDLVSLKPTRQERSRLAQGTVLKTGSRRNNN